MIKFENTNVYGWETAIRGMRNPLNSWDKSDSNFRANNDAGVWFGAADKALMTQLVKAGADHSKFMRMVTVTVDIIAPLYWWKEFDTYKVGTVRNSCSTMHTIHKKPFEMDDFSTDHMSGYGFCAMISVINTLNSRREFFIETGNKDYWYEMIQLLPSSYNQRATVQMNYAVLRNMYHARKNHKLDEWSKGFCEWVESLPCSELIIN